MVNLKIALERMGINTVSVLRAVQDVRAHFGEESTRKVPAMLDAVYGLKQVPFNNDDEALLTAQYIVEETIKRGCDVGNAPLMLSEAKEKALVLINDPRNACHFVKDKKQVRSMVGGSEVSTSKKETKLDRAKQLYAERVVQAETPLSDKEFHALMMKELNMGKAGAYTYLSTVKKALREEK